MKRISIALLLLLLAVPSWARMGVGMMGGGVASVATSCPSGTYIFAWGGEWPSDTDKACATSGDATGVDGAVSGVLLGTDYGEGTPDVGLRVDASNKHISYAQTADQYLDDTGAVTIWMRIYISAAPTGGTYIFWGHSSTTACVGIYVGSSREIVGVYRKDGSSNNVYSPSVIPATSWVDIAYSYDRVSANTHTINTGGTWKTDEADSLSTTTPGDISKIEIGETDEGGGFSMEAGEYVQITKWAIVSGYKAAKPW